MKCFHALAAATSGRACVAGPGCAGGGTCVSQKHHGGLAMVVGALILALEVIHGVYFIFIVYCIPAAETTGSRAAAVCTHVYRGWYQLLVAHRLSHRLDGEYIDNTRVRLPRHLSIRPGLIT